jgi:radical SAM superfamily enzyme YgiQ (UPF0313 family)
MRVLLLSTYDLGRQPFGLASPAAWLRDAGHAVDTCDLAVSPLAPKQATAADCIAFHLPMHTATRLAVPVISRVRELNPRARLIAYGLYAPLNAEYLRSLGISAIIGGEFERELLSAVEGTPADLVPLARLAFKTPSRESLPALHRYAHVRNGSESLVAGYTEASRGCKHLCRHCPIVPVYNGAFRIVQPDVVLEDIRQQVASGARHITFGDPDFLNGPAHAMRVVERVAREFPGLSYDVTIKVEHLLKHSELLQPLRETGCLFVTSAVESLEGAVLEKLDKGHTRADFLDALRLTRAAGLPLNPTFVPFTPWTTKEGYRDLLRVIAAENLVDQVAPVQFALRLLIPAGSRVLDLDEVQPMLQGFDASALVWRWSHPQPEMDELARTAFHLAAEAHNQKCSRPETFARLWAAVFDGDLWEPPALLDRAAIPFLEEPWYC